MANIHFYDVLDENEAHVFTSGLHSHTITSHFEPISTENIVDTAEVVSIFVTSRITREFMVKMPRLKLIACRSAGFNNVDMNAAHELGIHVVTVPSYGDNTVAEYTFALLLSLTRRLPETMKAIHENATIAPRALEGTDLYKKTIGVLGTGKIGKKVISIARGFGMNVLAYDSYEDKNAAEALGFTYTSVEKLLSESDVITLHLPYTQDTHHILNTESFSHLKKGVFIINTARGELIDTKALLLAIEKNLIRGVALDVVEGEEMLRERSHIIGHTMEEVSKMSEATFYITALGEHTRVILTPHNAYNTYEAVGRINSTTIQNISHFLNGNISNEVFATVANMGSLILVRHTESEWNQKGIWTGTRDMKLTLKGFEDARLLGTAIKDIKIDRAYVSMQVRTMETLSSMLGTMQQLTVPITENKALNERDYGDYTGKNKIDMRNILGQLEFDRVRRGWDVAIPHGETLKMVYERIVPYFLSEILPRLRSGENVLIVSHGNALRALIKYIENIDDEDIEKVEMMFGGALVYRLDESGHSLHKELRETTSASFDVVV